MLSRNSNAHNFSLQNPKIGSSEWPSKLNRSLSPTNLMSMKQKHAFFKSPNLNFCPFSHSHSVHRRLRVADIPLSDEDHDGDAVRETPSTKCFSPRRLVASLLAPLRPTKGLRLQQRRQNETGDLEAPSPSSPTNELKGSDESSKNLCLFAI